MKMNVKFTSSLLGGVVMFCMGASAATAEPRYSLGVTGGLAELNVNASPLKIDDILYSGGGVARVDIPTGPDSFLGLQTGFRAEFGEVKRQNRFASLAFEKSGAVTSWVAWGTGSVRSRPTSPPAVQSCR